jgi:hypothetical protein
MHSLIKPHLSSISSASRLTVHGERRVQRLSLPECWSCLSTSVHVVSRSTSRLRVRCARCDDVWSIAKPEQSRPGAR